MFNRFLGENVLGHLVKDVGVFTYHAINHMINFINYHFDDFFKGLSFIQENIGHIFNTSWAWFSGWLLPKFFIALQILELIPPLGRIAACIYYYGFKKHKKLPPSWI